MRYVGAGKYTRRVGSGPHEVRMPDLWPAFKNSEVGVSMTVYVVLALVLGVWIGYCGAMDSVVDK